LVSLASSSGAVSSDPGAGASAESPAGASASAAEDPDGAGALEASPDEGASAAAAGESAVAGPLAPPPYDLDAAAGPSAAAAGASADEDEASEPEDGEASPPKGAAAPYAGAAAASEGGRAMSADMDPEASVMRSSVTRSSFSNSRLLPTISSLSALLGASLQASSQVEVPPSVEES